MLKLGALALVAAGALGALPAGSIIGTVSGDASGAVIVAATLAVPASSRCAWEVLTDYDRLAEFVPSMRASRVRRRGPAALLVDQEVEGRFLIFSRSLKVSLEVREDPGRRIDFRDVSGADFAEYAGSWRLEPEHDPVRISYHVRARPRVPVPIGRDGFFKVTVEAMLRDVRTEILRACARQDNLSRAD